ncbi:DUF4260 family protein [Aeromicrobium sp. CTD01-1L150]|uniref:DUF4260 family protein n=1 Tax=Aeromicrobium sp. CTD01-1L150 TaxID=3341830 RepID=UPI0035C1D3BE
MSVEEGSDRQVLGWQRAENALIALSIFIVLIAWGHPWWLLLVAFLAFDLSALGYLVSQRVGAFSYNLVHNYAVPAILVSSWAVLQLGDVNANGLVLVAACWGFHVAVDRALGYGLKLGPFAHTHLGVIGKDRRIEMQRASASRSS